MKLLYLLLCITFTSSDKSANFVNKESKITGGKTGRVWMVAYTGALERKKVGYIGICTILSRDWLIAAEHNFFNISDPKNDVWIRVGTSYLLDRGYIYHIDELFPHPKRKNFSLINDYILIKTSVHMKLGPHIKSISPVAPSFIPLKGDELVISGWGVTQGGGLYAKRIIIAKIVVVTNAACSSAYVSAFGVKNYPIHESQFCASSARAAACMGDTGSPAVYNGRLVGFIIYSENTQYLCKTSKYPHILANMAHAYHWIQSTTKLSFQ